MVPACSCADVEGARTRPGRLFGLGGRRLLGVEVVAAVGDQPGQGQEHGHEDGTSWRGTDPLVGRGALTRCRVVTLHLSLHLVIAAHGRPHELRVGHSSRCAPPKWPTGSSRPGMPGTDTSARLVTQVTLTDTAPPATKFDVSVVIWGAGQVSPAPARVLAATESPGSGHRMRRLGPRLPGPRPVPRTRRPLGPNRPGRGRS